jgi:hypothetical protein
MVVPPDNDQFMAPHLAGQSWDFAGKTGISWLVNGR